MSQSRICLTSSTPIRLIQVSTLYVITEREVPPGGCGGADIEHHHQHVCVCVCLFVCVRAWVCLWPFTVKVSSVWIRWDTSEQINDFMLKTLNSSAGSLHRYFRMQNLTFQLAASSYSHTRSG